MESEGSLTVHEAAKLLGVSVRTLRRWDASGKLRARRHPVNNYRLYDRQDVLRLLGGGVQREDFATSASPQVSGCIGRSGLLDRIDEAFAAGARLVTLWGPPGIGKTRLATTYIETRVDDAVLCELAEASAVDEVATILAAALGVDPRGRPRRDAVTAALAAGDPRLVVLDNFEQLTHLAVETVGAWLDRAVESRFLVTSQQRLGLAREHAIEVAPLPEEDAMALFEERAITAGAPRELIAGEREHVRELVQRLDGIPLAIELAAARASVMTPREVLVRLGSSTQLQRKVRDGSPRHASLSAALTWSWQLLDEVEQNALRQCAVFRGGFTLAAAEAVLELGEAAVVEVIERLRGRSLLRAFHPPGVVQLRFDLYHVVRDYAGARIDEHELAVVAARHANYFLGLLENTISRRSVDLSALVLERANLLAITRRPHLPLCAARAVIVLDPLLARTSATSWHTQLLDDALAGLPAEAPPLLRAQLLCARGRIASNRGDVDATEQYLRRALALADGREGTATRADILMTLGWVHGERGELEADACLLQSIDLYRQIGDRFGEAGVLNDRANLIYRQGRLAEALEVWRHAMVVFDTLDDDWNVGRVLGNIALAEHELGELTLADADFRRALQLLRREADPRTEAIVSLNRGELELDRGNHDEAEALLESALRINEQIEIREFEPYPLVSLAWVAIDRGELELARRRALRAIEVSAGIQNLRSKGLAQLSFGVAALLDGDLESAIDGLRRAEQLCGRVRDARQLAVARTFLAAALVHRDHRAALSTLMQAREVATTSPDLALPSCIAVIAAALEDRQWDAELPPSTLARAAQRAAQLVATRRDHLTGQATIEVAADGRWFRSGGRLVELHRRRTLCGVLCGLVAAYQRGSAEGASVDELFAAGWPGERIHRQSALHRVQNAISTLRREGLSEVLVHVNERYCFDNPDRLVIKGAPSDEEQ